VRDTALVELIAALAPRATRATAARALAGAIGADDFLLLVRDAELGVMLPAPGFAQTMRGGRAWRAFVEKCGTLGRHSAIVDLPADTQRPATAIALNGIAAVLMGGSPPEAALEELHKLLPMLGAAVCAELEAVAATAAAEDARRAASRANALAAALEAARAEGTKLNARLREEHRRKDDFLAMLSHELRNPLAPLVSSLELLRRRALQPAEMDRQLEVMQRQVTQLTRLVEDLLDVSRVSLGRVTLRRQPILLRDVLQSALDAVRPLVEARRHRLIVSIADEPLPLNGDQARLIQVFANLLHNAAKYTDPGGRIEITATGEGADAVVRVIDNGIGMSADFLPRVFDLFEQAPVSLARANGGLGIGLTLVRTLVELHGGQVSAHSAGPGTGSAFLVRLPTTSVAHGSPGTAATSDIPTSAQALRILVVDDNVDAADTLGAMLRLMGHHVEVVYSGVAALQRAGDLGVDLVFLDIGLPDIDGFEVMQRLRRTLRRNAWCVALTGYGSEETRRRCKEAGFDEHVVKPASLERLADIASRVPTDLDRCPDQAIA
jgi:signal transduction histidine kinase/ActR/RegA family two-component response regulator